jgi:hypothetical protein
MLEVKETEESESTKVEVVDEPEVVESDILAPIRPTEQVSIIEDEDRSRGRVDMGVYKIYFRYFGGFTAL